MEVFAYIPLIMVAVILVGFLFKVRPMLRFMDLNRFASELGLKFTHDKKGGFTNFKTSVLEGKYGRHHIKIYDLHKSVIHAIFVKPQTVIEIDNNQVYPAGVSFGTTHLSVKEIREKVGNFVSLQPKAEKPIIKTIPTTSTSPTSIKDQIATILTNTQKGDASYNKKKGNPLIALLIVGVVVFAEIGIETLKIDSKYVDLWPIALVVILIVIGLMFPGIFKKNK